MDKAWTDGHRVLFAKDATIYTEGEDSTGWYEIVTGVVRTCRYLPSGDRQVTGFFVRGQVFGVEAGLYRSTAEAVTEALVVRRPHRWFEIAGPAAGENAGHPLRVALKSAEDRVQLLVLKGATARLAAFLLAAAIREGGADYVVHLPMRRTDIADYLAIDVATVSRTLSRFVRRRLLQVLHGNRFLITDLHGLEEIAGGDGPTELGEAGVAPPPGRTTALPHPERCAPQPRRLAPARAAPIRSETRWG
jgi:CRP-like cAMP-binding protein